MIKKIRFYCIKCQNNLGKHSIILNEAHELFCNNCSYNFSMINNDSDLMDNELEINSMIEENVWCPFCKNHLKDGQIFTNRDEPSLHRCISCHKIYNLKYI